jgi:hypothetical protein
VLILFKSSDHFLVVVQSGPKVLTEESLGVNYRALNDLFNLQAQRKGTINYDISVQMIEIYNEQVRDLLQDNGNKRYPFLLDYIFILTNI